MKSSALKELEALATAEAKRKHPNTPPEYLKPRRYDDRKANGLTKAITDYIRLRGFFASRVSNTGIYDRKLGRFIPTTARRGLPDITATVNGRSLFIEVKIGRDRLSEYQQEVKDEQEQSGGLYFVAHDFTSFKTYFDELTN